MNNIGFLLVDASRLMRRHYRKQIEASLSLPFAQIRTLVRLTQCQGVRQVDLAELLELQPIALARIIDQLEASGLVERRFDPADRRANRIYLTPAAEPYLRSITAGTSLVREEAMRGMEDHEIAALASALQKIIDNLSSTPMTKDVLK
jgi:DNA-binding MarR family transcriptional regulator